MSKINYPASSPYGATAQTSWYISNYASRAIPASGDDSTITLSKKYEYRPDTLSYDLYGTPAYWWVFAVRNRNTIQDPVWDMVVGATITVPSLANLKKALGT
jgi:hypothetical protein